MAGMVTNIKGLDEARRAMRNIVQRVSNAAPMMKLLAFELVKMWQMNLRAGPNERWEAGASRRVRTDPGGGVTLRDRGEMEGSIKGVVTSPTSCAVGSTYSVRGRSRDWSLLAIHEMGATIKASPGHALAIPLTAQARRMPPRQMPGLFMIKRAGRAPILATPLLGGRGKNRGEVGVTPQYILLTSVRIPARPTSPFDWKANRLLPAADQFVRFTVGDYVIAGNQGGSATA